MGCKEMKAMKSETTKETVFDAVDQAIAAANATHPNAPASNVLGTLCMAAMKLCGV